MPTNILLDLIRTRRCLKWGIPAMLLAAPYLLAASICTAIIANGAPGWLNIPVVLFTWNALKMLWLGPVNLVLLIRARASERGGASSTTRGPGTVRVSDPASSLDPNSLAHPR